MPIFLAATRQGIGTDYQNYVWYFNAVGTKTNIVSFSFGFDLINVIAFRVFHNVIGMFFLCALITYGFVLFSLYKLRNDLSIGLGLWIYFCFYYTASLNVMRQLIAVSIILYGVTFLLDKKPIKFLIAVFVACSIHISAIVCLVFVFLYLIEKTGQRYVKIILLVSCVVLFFVGGYLMNFAGGLFGVRYEKYIARGGMISLSYLLGRIPALLLLLFPVVINKYWIKKKDRYGLLYNIAGFTIAMNFLGYYAAWAGRLLYYFDVVQVFIYPIVIAKFRNSNNRRLLTMVTIMAYTAFFFYSSVHRGSNECIPYMSIFF